MAYREVTMLEVKEVLRLWLRGVPKKRIATQRGLDPKTVRRQVELAQECGLRREGGETALTDELLVVLAEKLRPAVVSSRRPRRSSRRWITSPQPSSTSRSLSVVAGFQVSISGRFWVSTEELDRA